MVLNIHIEYWQFLDKSIWRIDGILTSTATSSKSEHGSNGDKGMTSHYLLLKNLSLYTECS